MQADKKIQTVFLIGCGKKINAYLVAIFFNFEELTITKFQFLPAYQIGFLRLNGYSPPNKWLLPLFE